MDDFNAFIADVLYHMTAYNGSDTRRIGHALKVFGYALIIGGQLPTFERESLLTAAVLHDIGIHNAEQKHQSSAGEFQELEGPPVARTILSTLDAPAPLVARVCYLVGHHHSYTKIDGADFQALIEADFLVNIEEDGLSGEAAASIGKKYFRTQKGKQLLVNLFGIAEQ
ncbi:HD domain-containing protein [Ethanoligenens sp.]|uniref:HD domain-containing protein n=1 Tax=Ethanoligenens sp. TaxID=2099655 RepID=UPI0039E7BDA5